MVFGVGDALLQLVGLDRGVVWPHQHSSPTAAAHGFVAARLTGRGSITRKYPLLAPGSLEDADAAVLPSHRELRPVNAGLSPSAEVDLPDPLRPAMTMARRLREHLGALALQSQARQPSRAHADGCCATALLARGT